MNRHGCIGFFVLLLRAQPTERNLDCGLQLLQLDSDIRPFTSRKDVGVSPVTLVIT